MTERFDWSNSDDPQDVVHQLVERLYAGKTVLFPTAATYALVAYAERPETLARLRQGTASDDWSPALALHDAESSFQYVDNVGTLGRRLIERGLPGPITVIASLVDDPDLLSDETRELVVHDGKIRLRVPAHESVLETLRLLPEPLVLLDGPATAATVDGALQVFGALIDIVVDDGPAPFGKPTTVLEIAGEELLLRREGVLPQRRITRLTSEIITFVCTGNSCRSPMAEAIFRTLLAKELNCGPEELPEHGFIVQSAGLAAYDGAMASAHAQEVAKQHGATLEDHVAQTIMPQMVQFSDRLYVMTKEHLKSLLSVWPEAAAKVSLLGGNEDIADPIGGNISQYQRCAAQMLPHLHKILADIKSKQPKRS